jgi:pilus assembly protein Flp/PilA
MLRSFWTDESGPGLAEYAVLIALITVALIAVITPFREAIIGVFTKVVAVLQSL